MGQIIALDCSPTTGPWAAYKGSAGLGKLSLSQHLAQALLCEHQSENELCQHANEALDTHIRPATSAELPCGRCHSCKLVQAGTHSDLYLVTSETRSIGVDTIRQLCSSLSESPRLGRAKVAIINDAEKMTEAAANALLKTLEEPAGQATLLLISAYPERLLPTIRSRCQQWLVPNPATDLALAWLTEQGLDLNTESSWRGALNVNQGSPLAA